jgi:cell division protein FtsQ
VFRVRQIELVGLRHLAPDAVIAALRLGPDASVFADTRELAERVRGVPGVAAARVVRHPPAALAVIVREVEPVALAPASRGGALVAVDATGRPLPFDPARGELDLPIAAAAEPGLAGVLALVQAVDPALYHTITSARALARGDIVLEAGPRRVLLGRDAGPEVIRAVTLVMQDLATRRRSYDELDARFSGQVLVRQAAAAGPRGGRGGRG